MKKVCKACNKKVVNKLLDYTHVANAAKLLSDKELAEALICEVWGGMSIYSLESSLVNEAIERLFKNDTTKRNSVSLPTGRKKAK